MSTRGDLSELRADCAGCVGLCCVAPTFQASADFALDKDAGQPCPNLDADFRCGIHAQLRERGFPGCAAYDCFGAGQKVTQVTFDGRGWREDPRTAAQMFAVFGVMRQLHQLLWYLAEARGVTSEPTLQRQLGTLVHETERLTVEPSSTLERLDPAEHHRRVDALLRRTSEAVRAQAPGPGKDLRRADLVGADLAGADLRGVDLRGALLVGADLRGADLGWADCIGADLRGAHLERAHLAESLFLTQHQVGAALGDGTTTLPTDLFRPEHWGSGTASVTHLPLLQR